ncbi:Uncharacterised protein [Mycobacteroides abscessus subsp. abscessus]|nr:Uncharacterised protein [Mycobacteroides abscessus subsp. abscessus]
MSSSSSVARSAAALRSSVNTVCLPASSAYQPAAARANGSPPAPPYSSGRSRPNRPASPILFQNSRST